MIKFEEKPEWRNWQTHKTQNLGLLREREGSTPSSGTYEIKFESNEKILTP